MGSALSPIMAEIVMQDLENIFKTLNLLTLFYYRYVDDIVFAAQDNNVNYILDAFNNYHQKLKFTSEKECGRGLSFLDLLLYKDNNKICIDIIRKPFRVDFFRFSLKIHYAIKLKRYIAF